MTTPQKAIGRQVSIKWVLMLEVSTNGNRHIGRQDVWAAILKESTCGAAVLGVSDIRRKHIILEVRRQDVYSHLRRQDVEATILERSTFGPLFWQEARVVGELTCLFQCTTYTCLQECSVRKYKT